jgi:hypothetical protein
VSLFSSPSPSTTSSSSDFSFVIVSGRTHSFHYESTEQQQQHR